MFEAVSSSAGTGSDRQPGRLFAPHPQFPAEPPLGHELLAAEHGERLNDGRYLPREDPFDEQSPASDRDTIAERLSALLRTRGSYAGPTLVAGVRQSAGRALRDQNDAQRSRAGSQGEGPAMPEIATKGMR
jgi:hypothetical protein